MTWAVYSLIMDFFRASSVAGIPFVVLVVLEMGVSRFFLASVLASGASCWASTAGSAAAGWKAALTLV